MAEPNLRGYDAAQREWENREPPEPGIEHFEPGDRVLYVPNHANGDTAHPDCERGIVSSKNSSFVFVRYYRKDGTLPDGGVATSPQDLEKLA